MGAGVIAWKVNRGDAQQRMYCLLGIIFYFIFRNTHFFQYLSWLCFTTNTTNEMTSANIEIGLSTVSFVLLVEKLNLKPSAFTHRLTDGLTPSPRLILWLLYIFLLPLLLVPLLTLLLVPPPDYFRQMDGINYHRFGTKQQQLIHSVIVEECLQIGLWTVWGDVDSPQGHTT